MQPLPNQVETHTHTLSLSLSPPPTSHLSHTVLLLCAMFGFAFKCVEKQSLASTLVGPTEAERAGQTMVAEKKKEGTSKAHVHAKTSLMYVG